MKNETIPSFLCGEMGTAEINFVAAAEGEAKRNPTVDILAYTGGKMNVGFGAPVVVKLDGLTAANHVTLLKDHDRAKIVGQSTSVDIGPAGVTVRGEITAPEGDESRKIILGHAKNNFSWQASVGVDIKKYRYVGAGKSVKANGTNHKGPVIVVTEGLLREVSFVGVGADSNTESRIAAELSATHSKEITMDPKFKTWMEAKGHVVSEIEDSKIDELKAEYEAEKVPQEPQKVEAGMPDFTASRKAQADEDVRVAAIRKIECSTPELLEIRAEALLEGWSTDKAELAILRAARPEAPNTSFSIGSAPETTGQVLEAAFQRASGFKDAELEGDFGDKTMQAAHTQFKSGIGIQQLLMESAWMGGHEGRHFSSDTIALGQIMRAAFSTTSLPNILSNTANKHLLASYNAVESSWRKISDIGSVTDFKEITSHRLTGDMKFAKVAPGGKLEHATVGEEDYSNQADTYGRMFALTRTHIVNDDMGAFRSIPRKIGRGGALKVNEVFWTAFMNNAAFFASGNNNYMDGSATNLSLASLEAANLLIKDQKDSDGNPLGVPAKYILVPNALEVLAQNIFDSLTLNETTTANKGRVVNNPFSGKFEVVSSSYLNLDTITGYSALAWYLLVDPMDIPTIEIVFLNGRQTPVIEQAQADFDTLGIQWRAYFDFGVSLQDPNGGMKSLGEAP